MIFCERHICREKLRGSFKECFWGKTIFGERVYLGNECIWGKSVLRKKGGGLDYFTGRNSGHQGATCQVSRTASAKQLDARTAQAKQLDAGPACGSDESGIT